MRALCCTVATRAKLALLPLTSCLISLHCACCAVPRRAVCAVLQGMGDALLTYENEAFFTNLVVAEKDRLPYFTPDNNIRVGRQGCDRESCGWGGATAAPPPWRMSRHPCLPVPCLTHIPAQQQIAITKSTGSTRDPHPNTPMSSFPVSFLQIQCPMALVDANLDLAAPEVRRAATAFCEYLYTREAQREFAACGFRWVGGQGVAVWGGRQGETGRAGSSCGGRAGCALGRLAGLHAVPASSLHCTALPFTLFCSLIALAGLPTRS